MAAAAAQKSLETKAAVEFHGLVRIAFAGGDGIAEAGDEHVAHRDLGGDALRGAVAEWNVDSGDGGAAGAHPQSDFLIARHGALLQRPVAVVEIPDAGRALRQRPRNGDADRVIARRQIVFALAVALAGVEEVAEIIETEIGDDVLGPA